MSRTILAMLALFALSPAVLATTSGRNSAATVTALFTDSCRGFAARSSKDISHVVLRYADGRTAKDESIAAPDYGIAGGPGDELVTVVVKSGTTVQEFACGHENRAPVARLEILTPPIAVGVENCGPFWDGGLACDLSTPRTDWTDADVVPDAGGGDSGLFHWTCAIGWSLCPLTFTFRGIGSSDPDGDIRFWSLDFGDGTSTSGNWSTAAPTQVSHEYSFESCDRGICPVTLTVTDSAGQSATATLQMVFLDIAPS